MAKKRQESDTQIAYIDWCRLNGIFAYSIPNEGCTSAKFGKKLNDMGREAGMPDTCVPYPSGGYGAFYIEFKRPGKKARKKQSEIHDVLTYCGNLVTVCDDLTTAIKLTVDYLEGKYERKVINIS